MCRLLLLVYHTSTVEKKPPSATNLQRSYVTQKDWRILHISVDFVVAFPNRTGMFS